MADPSSPSRWQVLFDQAADAILLIAQPGYRITAANQEACRLTGYSAAELGGRPIESLFSPEALRANPLEFERVDRGEVVRRNRKLTRRDGSDVPVEMHSKRMPDGTYQTIIRDTTESGTALDELRRSEEKFAKAFKTSPDAINITRVSDGTYLEINEGFTAMTGYTAADVVGRSSLPGDLGIWVNKDDRDRVVAELLATGSVRGYEAPFRKKDGVTFFGMMSARRIDIQGVDCLLTITRDITEKKRTEEALRHAQKLEALGVLAGGIAHDFNNLLTGIFGYIATANEELAPGHPARSDLDRALGVFDRAKALSHQLLTFAKGGDPVKKLVEIQNLVRETAHFALSGSSVRPEIVIEPELWPCEADLHQVGQVLDNLLLNARHAMPGGGVVTVRAENVSPGVPVPPPLGPGRWVKVTVADHGTGIPAPVLTKVFDPFFTTKEKGNGLGLATAFSILKRHGGHIFAESAVGEGSRFTFYLPASSGTPEADLRPRTSPLKPSGGRILVLDDEPFIRDLTSKLLGSWGYQVSTAPDSRQTVDQYRTALGGDRFDLVILDLTIPGGEGGLQTLEHLKKLDPLVQAVASSGYSDDPIMADPLKFGFLGALPKPYRESEFRDLLSCLPRRLPDPLPQ